eukprot:CAMPEP_0196780574 /NCGR_PEP_ID=MMETSP1104-20130614/8053_1 /TAXON_ID=33652 /ORGANISM="Cafeteria sp., Strain Caron Lab Isolate" /LENGTH=336 /DNA_ID=CAMNT_0042150787 /DNA_START=50 /DNA_END=1060 /DNA_ORIENTATION=+
MSSASKAPIRVAVTGAAGQIGYALLPLIAKGDAFGPDQPVILQLLDLPFALKSLEGSVMELQDGAYPLVQNVIATADPVEGFKDADYAILVGAFPRKAGMERKDLLEKNSNIFKEQGRVINEHASPNIKVLVVGNPANTNALILRHFAPRVPAKNISALTRLDHNRSIGQVATKLGVLPSAVRKVTVWGNHSSTQYPDLSHATVDKDGARSKAMELVGESWAREEMLPIVAKRGAAIISARGASSAMSAANAAANHMRSWVTGTAEDDWVSMAIVSDGSYDVPEGLVYSFPVTCSEGEWHIVQGLSIDDFSRARMDATAKELIEERDTALAFVGTA